MKAFVLCCFLAAVSLTSPAQSVVVRSKRSTGYYHGPPAPLRPDGNVAPTPEVAAAAAHQQAAHQQELRRLQAAAALAAAHPDTTSPAAGYNGAWDNSGNSWNSGASQWNSGASTWNGGNALSQWNSHSDDSGQYNPALNNEGQYNPAWNNPGPDSGSSHWSGSPAPAAPQWNAGAPAWNSGSQWNGGNSYSHAPAQPAPLNHDGTVAPTKEWQAIAAAHAAAHQQIPAAGHHYGRKRRSLPTAHFLPSLSAVHGLHGLGYAAISAPVAAAHYVAAPAAYAPAHHSAAPLRPDGTVAETPEVAHLAAAHLAAKEHQLSILAAEAAKSGSYAGAYSGSYGGSHDDGSYHGEGAYSGYDGSHDGSYSDSHDDGSYHGEGSSYGSGYAGHDDGSYHGDHDDGSYHGEGSYGAGAASYAAAPVALNHDGTVAHTPEYLAIAAKHAAAHHGHY